MEETLEQQLSTQDHPSCQLEFYAHLKRKGKSSLDDVALQYFDKRLGCHGILDKWTFCPCSFQ